MDLYILTRCGMLDLCGKKHIKAMTAKAKCDSKVRVDAPSQNKIVKSSNNS